MVHIIGQENSIFNRFISEIRDANIQTDSMRFRRNLERIGEIFAYEISKTLSYTAADVQTPLGIANMQLQESKVVLSTVLRAGLPMHQGLLNYFDNAENAFITAYRRYHKDNSFDIKIGYLSSPSLEGKILILSDPMLASGSSLVLAYENLMDRVEKPLHTHIVTAISSKEGLEYMQKKLGRENITFWCGAIDDELTAKAYIVPGLGDAGDLAFGSKI